MGATEIIISLIGGFCAGILNALAGFGSIISLAIYMDVIGIPGHLANATNRVNILASSSVSAWTFHKNGKLDLEKGKWIIGAVFLGAMVGVYMATQLDADGFKNAFKYLLVVMFLIILLNPKRFINPDLTAPAMSPWITMPLYFLLGIYAGFIQAGFGVVFLMVAVIMSKYDLVLGNGLKIAIVAIYTVAVLSIFQLNGMVIWKAGLTLAIGQALGGYIATKYMVNMEGANKYAYWFLLTIVFLVLLKNFEVWKWFG